MWGALFPGQGSQHVGMGRFLFDNFNETRHLFEEASDLLKTDFKKLCFEGPDSELALTANTQPALLLVSVATFRTLKAVAPFNPTAGAGHSVGEYAALVASEAMSFAGALKAVRIRGQAMQRATPLGLGGMLAVIGLSDGQVQKLCSWAQESSNLKPLEPANYNAPGQVVVSGSLELINWLRANVNTEIFAPETPKLRLIPLNVSAPFHCSLMKPAETEMRDVLDPKSFKKAQWPVVQNIVAAPVIDPAELVRNLVAQISGPVRWVECIQQLQKLGARKFIEFGPGKVLSGLNKKIDSSQIETFNINSLDELKAFEGTRGQ